MGQDARVLIPSLNKTFNGRIIEVGSAADVASRAFSVKIEVENPEMLIRPGMIAEIRITAEQEKEMLIIPVTALLHDLNDVSYVFIVDTIKNKAFRRNVSPGMLVNDQIEITSGISQEELIVEGGQQKLVDGSPVTITK
jgi:RND family efflux transporter MFP subunit